MYNRLTLAAADRAAAPPLIPEALARNDNKGAVTLAGTTARSLGVGLGLVFGKGAAHSWSKDRYPVATSVLT